jgi:hypothetical protein
MEFYEREIALAPLLRQSIAHRVAALHDRNVTI